MNAARLNKIAEDMLTPEFVRRVHLCNNRIMHSLDLGIPYSQRDLAKDLDVPLPVAKLFISIVTAIGMEQRMADAILAELAQSEAHH